MGTRAQGSSPGSVRATGARVLVVDDHALLAEAIAAELAHVGCDARVVEDPSTVRVLQAVQELAPDVVLLDLFLGSSVGTSIPLIGPLRDAGTEVLVLTGVTNEVLLASCLEAGASGVLSKAAEVERVLEAVMSAVRHERVQPAQEREALLDRLRAARREEAARLAPFERLTTRERQVLEELMDGSSAAEIAQAAVVSLATVRSQIRAILQKLGVSSQLAAVALAHHAGWSGERRAATGPFGRIASTAPGAAAPDWSIAAVGAA